MKQKHVFLKHLTYIVSMASLLIPTANLLNLNSILFSNEGNHPKNVDLTIPDAVACPSTQTFYVGSNCSVNVIANRPTASIPPPPVSCPISRLAYTVDGGPEIVVTPDIGGNYPLTIDIGPRSVDTFIIRWVVDDCETPNNICNHLIMIRDTTPPVLTCPGNITVGTDLNGRLIAQRMPTVRVDFGPPTVTENCSFSISDIVNNYTGNSDTIANFPLGTTMVCWKAKDRYGNLAKECCHTVTVIDNVPPVITCPSDTIKVQCPTPLPSPYSTFMAFRAAGGSATDDVRLDSTSFRWVRDETRDSTCANRKLIRRHYTIRDTSGNADTCYQVISIRDTIPPTLICKDSTIYLGNTGTVAGFHLWTLVSSTTDNCGGIVRIITPHPDIVNFNCTHAAVNNGRVPITITVRDTCGNMATCTATVTVRDTIKPTINCPINITASTSGATCASVVNYNVTAMDNCGPITPVRTAGMASGSSFPVGIHTITHTATDPSGNSATCSFTITVMDMINPTISCIAVDSVGLNDSCYMTVPDLRPKVTYGDNCGGNITLTQTPLAGSVIPSRHDSVHTFIFTVTDTSGLTAVCTTLVTAKDKLGPDIVCIPKRIISLSTNQATVTAQSFITSAIDKCGGTLSYQARRMGKICGSNVDDDFGPTVDFCCDDVNDTIMVVVRVSDLRGNFTECMDTVIVRDLVKPTIIHKLPDVTISCEYPYDIRNLSQFGTYEHQDSVRKTITITDPSNPSSPTIYQNGVFNENCPDIRQFELVETRGLNMCNIGRIERNFYILDGANNIETDTQFIYIVDFHKFNESNITWPPAQVDYYDCQRAVPDTAVTKSPVLRNDRCSQAAATFVDQPFNNPAYCKAILRTWTVIDWCQYKTNTPGSPGKWTFDQIIVIRDTVAPQITSHLPDFTLCTSNDECISAPMGFRRTQATDNCTPNNQLLWSYKLDLFNDGGTPEFSGKDEIITRSFPIGDHKFIWEVRDLCGNTATTTYLVKVRDCKGPNAVVMKGLATTLMPVMNMVSVKAKFFDNFSSDNCTPAQQLKFSYSRDLNDTLRIFNCDSLGTRTVHIWVTDLARNQTQTATTIDIQDNHKTCGPTALLDISGSIYTENGKFVSDTKVKIDGGETEREVMTDQSGKYTFSNLAKLNDYEIKPEKNTGHLDGITTLDLVIMQRHILGLKTLDSPYKLIAADINNSKSVTAADLVELRKVVLGVESEFRFNTSWRFVDAAHKFADTKEPWIFSSKMQYNNLDQNMKKSDFIAIKIGDVNGSISEKLTQQTANRTADKWLMNIEDVRVSTGEIVVVPVYSDMMDQLSGVQWTMEVKPGLVYTGVEAAAYGVKDENIGILEKNGKQYITIAYHHNNDIDNNTRKELFNLVFVANKNADLSSLLKFSGDITPALAITKGLEEKSIGFSFTTKVPDEAFINQNQPNPFRGETVIQMSLKKPSMTQITIYDAKGSAVYSGVENLSSGNQSIIIGSKHLGNQTGIFYCKIKNNEVSKVIKMLRIE